MFSKACMYAIRATVLLCTEEDASVHWPLARIAKGTGAPEAFMGKVLQQLVHAGIVDSVKGPRGGFAITARKKATLQLGEVVTAIDDDGLFKGCALGFPRCDERKPCPVHDQVVIVRERLKNVLGATLITDLGADLKEGSTFLQGKLRS